MDLNRADLLAPATFIDDHLIPQIPVVVSGEAAGWPARDWSWASLVERFGDRDVDVYDDWFVPTGVMRLSDFVSSRVGVAHPDRRTSYVRWFSRTRPGAGRWADDVLNDLADDWSQPSFLPTTDYVVPFTPPGQVVDAAHNLFPYRGLFLSAQGARTRMHRDPWSSAAALCQLRGTKRVRMYSPDQQEELMQAALAGDGAGDTVRPAQEGTLDPGDVIYIPDGWWHQVDTLTDSISLTWNFVHRSGAHRLAEYVRAFPTDPELTVVDYFLAGRFPAGETTSVQELVTAAVAAAEEHRPDRQGSVS